MRTTPRRLRWFLPALLVLVWLVVGGVGGPFAGKLGEVQSNDSASFLPASAEATQVAGLQKAFSDTTVIPAIVVAERAGGTTAADTAFLTRITGSVEGKTGYGGAASPVIPSQDGQAAEVIVPVDGSVDPGVTVADLRERLAQGTPDGLTVLVGGPGGQIADLTAAFGGIDGILVLVAGLVVIVILVVVYRSPLLPLLVVLSALFALGLASLAIYLLADHHVLTLDGQSQGILFILVFGAATDYALLLVSRFREELRDTPDRFDALRSAWRATVEPILASGGTVILGVLCLLFSDLNSNRGLGPVAAIGIGASLLASLTFLPAVLALLGRAAFWPVRPKAGSEHQQGLWWGLSRRIGARSRAYWAGSLLVLLVAAAFLPTLKAGGVAQSDLFLTDVDSVAAQDVIGAHFPGGSGSPAVIVTGVEQADAVAAAAQVDGVSAVASRSSTGQPGGAPKVVDGKVLLEATLSDAPDSEAAVATVQRVREAVHAVPGADALVGGPTATQLDTQTTSERDRRVIIPIVLLVVFVVLALLLRAIVAPLLLIGTVVLSFAATLGVSALVFNHVFHFPGADPVVPLFGFVFLVALGIDYNIFLMTRVREESRTRGTREGTLHGLAVTGGVITSAGVVLAATFAALAVIPILFLAQIAFIVAFGVLLDTLVVRSLLVPALSLEIGRKIWWPSALSRGKG
ncbi:MMPL family transporter [Rhodococcus antarcticus]|uniref:MMPL family transporter n=1 Tax=Rhodococcus antarcticus TaxID=2987751 RepID=A0ABY6P445_9NOCA|nr:MMPL family transporter [Rhodococcus antarcticus]UZJ26298.1 MMPL family transporter [Rhodococcus antarcticus]